MSAAHYSHKNDPAYTVTLALGGVSETARRLGVSKEYVSQWGRPPDKGGTGGYIPSKYWEDIIIWARQKKLRHINWGFLAKIPKRRLALSKAHKIKGDRFEREVANDLVAAGFSAHRVPLSGAVKGYPGDVLLETPVRGRTIIQCKVTNRRFTRGKTGVSRVMHYVDICRVYTAHEVYICMHKEVYYEWLHGRRPRLMNLPEMKTPGGQIRKDLYGYDVLVFRQDGSKEWRVMFPEKFFWPKKEGYK